MTSKSCVTVEKVSEPRIRSESVPPLPLRTIVPMKSGAESVFVKPVVSTTN